MSISEIMEKYNAGEINIEEANEQLKAAGAGISLKPLTDEERAARQFVEDSADPGLAMLQAPAEPLLSP